MLLLQEEVSSITVWVPEAERMTEVQVRLLKLSCLGYRHTDMQNQTHAM